MKSRRILLALILPLVASSAGVATFIAHKWNSLVIEHELDAWAQKFPEASIAWEGIAGTKEAPALQSLSFTRDGQRWIFEDVSWSTTPEGEITNPHASNLHVRSSDHSDDFTQVQAQFVRSTSAGFDVGNWQANWRPDIFGTKAEADVHLEGHWQGASLSHRADRDSFEARAFDDGWSVTLAGSVAKVEWHDFPVGDYLKQTPPLTLHVGHTDVVRRDDELPLHFPPLAQLWSLDGEWLLADRKLGALSDGERATDDGNFRINFGAEDSRITAQVRRYDFADPDTRFAQLFFKKSPRALSKDEKEDLADWRESVALKEPPKLPPVENDLGADFASVLEAAEPWPEILASAKHAKSPHVIYLSSLAQVVARHCDPAKKTLARLISQPAPAAVLGKSFGLLAECELDPVKRRKLLEAARAYLPNDARLAALEKKTPRGRREPAAGASKKSTVSPKKNPKSERRTKSSGR